MDIIFFIEDNELLEIYNSIWHKVSNSVKKETDCEPTQAKNSENQIKVLQ